MKYILQPNDVKMTIQVFKKGLRYDVIATKFTKDGRIDYKDYVSYYFPHKVKSTIRDIISEEVLFGTRLSEIEVTNYTNLDLKLGLVKERKIKLSVR